MARIGRPKRFSDPARIHLLVEKEIKQRATALAFANGITLGQLFETLLEKETTLKKSEKNHSK